MMEINKNEPMPAKTDYEVIYDIKNHKVQITVEGRGAVYLTRMAHALKMAVNVQNCIDDHGSQTYEHAVNTVFDIEREIGGIVAEAFRDH